jgi:hypothetical protein
MIEIGQQAGADCNRVVGSGSSITIRCLGVMAHTGTKLECDECGCVSGSGEDVQERIPVGEKASIGYVEDETCNRPLPGSNFRCDGIIEEYYGYEKNCSCHINPPCSSCTDQEYYCPNCTMRITPDEEYYDE